MTQAGKSPFREEALRHAREGREEGEVLRISPAWTRWAYWILVASAVSAAAFTVLGSVHQYASGPAVVLLDGRAEVAAPAEGTVRGVEVAPGQRVEAGAVLVRLDAAHEEAQLARLQRECDLQLTRALRDPGDPAAREALSALRVQRELAAARLEQLVIRAPRAGVVGDVRIRLGQRLEVGDTVLTISDERAPLSVLAMLPGQYRPQLGPGMPLRFEVAGYPYAYQVLTIEAVGSQVVGPEEVRRYLGQQAFDTVKLEGPVVLVQARHPGRTFVTDEGRYELYHGMTGAAEARVRSESILLALVPALRRLFEVTDG